MEGVGLGTGSDGGGSEAAAEKMDETTRPSHAKLRAVSVGHQQRGGGMEQGLCAGVGTVGVGMGLVGLGANESLMLELEGEGRRVGSLTT